MTQLKPTKTPALFPALTRAQTSTDVGEVYIQKPHRAVVGAESSKVYNWVNLNAQFALVFLHEQPYLMDVAQVQQHWFLSNLHEQTLPLVSRPLLLPVSYTIGKIDGQLFEQYCSMLIPLGIELDLMGNTKLVMRTIPLLFPQLDINQFLKRLLCRLERNLVPPDQMELLALLVACQSLDAYQLTQDDKSVLVDYLYQQLTASNSFISGCLRLDTDKCRELLEFHCHD